MEDLDPLDGSLAPGELVDDHQPVVPEDRGFDSAYGFELVELGDGLVRGRVPVGPHLLGPAGTVQGGMFAALAESLALAGTISGGVRKGEALAGVSNSTVVLSDVSDGELHGEARCRLPRGRELVWEVEVTDADGEPCASSTVVVGRLSLQQHELPGVGRVLGA